MTFLIGIWVLCSVVNLFLVGYYIEKTKENKDYDGILPMIVLSVVIAPIITALFVGAGAAQNKKDVK